MTNTNILLIIWNPNPIVFSIFSYEVRWYSIFWIIALAAGSIVVSKIFKQKNISDEKFSQLFIYSFVGIILGARLGHCIFYEAQYYIHHPLEAILPIKILADGKIILTGYAGLASHGGTLGLIVALYFYHRKTRIGFLDILGIISIAAPLSAGFIRIANFMNSEIIGVETSLPWGIVFVQVDNIVRHPTQLYEAFAYFLIFIIIWYIYKRNINCKPDLFLGLCLSLIFTFRFFIEFIKERQVDFENNLRLDMGQLLSIPFIIVGVFIVINHYIHTNKASEEYI